MPFIIRSAQPDDLDDLYRLATSLAAHGFLTLPESKEELLALIDLSIRSFEEGDANPDQAKYLFVLADDQSVVGSSLIVGRHGTPQNPHLYFQVDPKRQTLQLKGETTGRTEVGGLILDPKFRGHPEKLGKRLSLARLWYIGKHPARFCPHLIAELLPPFSADGSSPLWEALGRKFTGMTYQEADRLSRWDKSFVKKNFPAGEVAISSLPKEAREIIGKTGPGSSHAAKILKEAGFSYLNQIDPFDGGPHYGAKISDLHLDAIEKFFSTSTKVILDLA